MKIFDTHVHFPWGEDRDPDDAITELRERAAAAGVVHLCLLGSRFGDYNERVTRAIERDPELFIACLASTSTTKARRRFTRRPRAAFAV